jgi:hypothetical protein
MLIEKYAFSLYQQSNMSRIYCHQLGHIFNFLPFLVGIFSIFFSIFLEASAKLQPGWESRKLASGGRNVHRINIKPVLESILKMYST